MGIEKRRKRSVGYERAGWRLGRHRGWVAERRDQATGKRERVALAGQRTPLSEAKALFDRFIDGHAVVARSAAKTVGELWHAWMADRLDDGYTASDQVYRHNWRALASTFEHRLPASITVEDCRAYARSRFDDGKAPATVHTELSRLRRCLAWAVERQLLDRAPYVWTPGKGKHRERVLTIDEARALLSGAATAHVRLFIILAMTTGARHRAILGLEWSKVDFDAGTISYEVDVAGNDPMSKGWTKGRATVPMGQVLRQALVEAYRARQTDFVIEQHSKPLKDIRDGFAAAVERAGLDLTRGNITPHTLRHSVASWARMRGTDFHQIARLLGHADSRTTELVYTHVDASYLQQTVDLIDDELS